MKRVAAMVALLLVVGCSSKAPPAPTVAVPEAGAKPAPQVSNWNDEAFRLIKAERWAEAVEAAAKAVVQDAKSSASHFNLGRALLGAGRAGEAALAFDQASALTGAANADVEYFRGQALVAVKQEKRAAEVWAAALAGPLHGDAEIAAALKEVLPKAELPMAVGDVDGDTKPDLVQVHTDRIVMTSATGARLYEGAITPSGLKDLAHRVIIHPLSDGAPLIHVEIPACPYAPLNALYWYDGKKVGKVGDKEGPCTVFSAADNGLFQTGFRAGGIYLISKQRFDKGVFRDAGGASRLMWSPNLEQIGYFLTTITQWPLEKPEELFVSLQTYDEFQTRTAQGKWEFQQGGETGADYIQVKPVQDGKTLGIANVYLQKDAVGRMRILRIAWPK